MTPHPKKDNNTQNVTAVKKYVKKKCLCSQQKNKKSTLASASPVGCSLRRPAVRKIKIRRLLEFSANPYIIGAVLWICRSL